MDLAAAVLGHECAPRRETEATLTRMGLVVMSSDAATSDRLPGCGDILVADMRGGALSASLLSQLHDDPRPLVIVAGETRRALSGLVGRPAGTMVLSADDTAAGLRVAVAVCAGIVERSAATDPPPAIPGLRGRPRRSSAAAR